MPMPASRRLWLLTGGAVLLWLPVGYLSMAAPSWQNRLPLALLIVAGVWAALCLAVLLPGARRIHLLLVVFALALTAALSLFTRWFGIAGFALGYLGAMLFVATFVVIAALRLFRKKPGPRALIIPLTMNAMGARGILLCAWTSDSGPPIPTEPMSVADEIKYIRDMDQSDRMTGMMWIDAARDRVRLERVKALYRSGRITQPLDQYRAALVYQHASCADDYQVAYELASAAEASHTAPPTFPPLSHLAYDRWQMALGKRQTYGTQFPPIPQKRPCPPGH